MRLDNKTQVTYPQRLCTPNFLQPRYTNKQTQKKRKEINTDKTQRQTCNPDGLQNTHTKTQKQRKDTDTDTNKDTETKKDTDTDTDKTQRQRVEKTQTKT